MLNNVADAGPADYRSMTHGWHKESPETLAEAWFAEFKDRLVELIKQSGRALGFTTDLTFLHNATETPYGSPDTIAMLIVDDLQVPYYIRRELRWQEELNLNQLESILLKRLDEIIGGQHHLRKRFHAMHRAAEAGLQEIGHGAALRQIVLEPVPVDSGPQSLRQRRFRVEVDLLGEDLVARPQDHTVAQPAELIDQLRFWRGAQEKRAAAVKRRSSNPGKIEAERMALHLLRITNVEANDVGILEPRHCVQHPSPVVVQGAELTNLQFFIEDGRISTRFDFDGGYYHGGSIILHDTLPEIVQESLVGKKINEVISGGIFNEVSPVITGLGKMNRGTKLEVEPLVEWLDLSEFKAH